MPYISNEDGAVLRSMDFMEPTPNDLIFRLKDYNLYFHNYSWDNGTFNNKGDEIPFMKVLEMVPEDLKIKMLYHIDILGKY